MSTVQPTNDRFRCPLEFSPGEGVTPLMTRRATNGSSPFRVGVVYMCSDGTVIGHTLLSRENLKGLLKLSFSG